MRCKIFALTSVLTVMVSVAALSVSSVLCGTATGILI